MRNHIRVVAATVLGVSFLSASAFGTVIFEHTGKTDPALDGFLSYEGGDVIGPVDGNIDPGGRDAWNINTDGAEYGFYQSNGDQGDVSGGILLSVDLQMLDVNDPPDVGTQYQIRTGSKAYAMFFGRSGDDVSVDLIGNSSGSVEAQHTVTGGGGNYNLFQLLVDDGGQGELWVNGEKVDGINYDGFGTGATAVWWGDTGFVDGRNGNVNYAMVRLETGSDAVIPEPASLALLAVGGLFLLPRRKTN